MKIAINCRILNKRHGGPRRFLVNMLVNLAQIDRVNEYFLIVDREPFFVYPWPKNFKVINLKTTSRFIYEYIRLPKFINNLGVDIFLVPDPTFSPFIKTKKIAVYHDIIYFEKNHKREFKFFENLHHKIMIPICGKKTNLIICVSKFTEERVHTLLGFKNTRVLYEGVEDSFIPVDFNKQQEVLKKYDIKSPFLFYIGSMSPRKNVERIIDAFVLIKDQIPHNLYLIGGYSWKDSHIVKKLFNFQDRIQKIGHIKEEDLASIYSSAKALVYPSLYEGFGLPIVEAQACECPVITSNMGATKEISGEGALLVNPLSTSEIANAMVEISKNTQVKSNLIEKGSKNLKRFSWKEFAEKLVIQYEKL